MLALQLTAYDNPVDSLQVVELDDPDPPKAGEVLVQMEYSPINPADLLLLRGLYGILPPLPARLGSEGVGKVVSFGADVGGVRTGDRVLVPMGSNAWSERVLISGKELFALPDHADPRQLAMLSVNPPTAALLLSEYVSLAAGDWIIQNAAASGVGRWVVALAKKRGYRTVNLVRRKETKAELVAAGADEVFLEGPDTIDEIAEFAAKREIWLALDGVGGKSTAILTRALAKAGTLVMCGGLSGEPGHTSGAEIIFKDIVIRGFWLRYPRFWTSDKFAAAKREAAEMVRGGDTIVPVADTFSLGGAQKAVARALRGGKILLDLSRRT